jgi:membrane-associated phospholipid phosphatase
MMNTVRGVSVPSVRLITSYIFDWIIIIAMAGVGGGLEYKDPFRRPFSPVDLTISYPYKADEQIPVWLLTIIALIFPAILIVVVCFVFVPGPTAERGTPKALIWKRKLWEWHTGWMGLCLALATAFLVTQGMKNLFGKPRPDLLSRCDPDLNRIDEFKVSPFDTEVVDPRWVLVSSDICRNGDVDIMRDGFRSFPSGHSSCKLASSSSPPLLY